MTALLRTSSPSAALNYEFGNKRPRAEDNEDESENYRFGVRKYARHTAAHITAPLENAPDGPEDGSEEFPSFEVSSIPFWSKEKMSPVPEEDEEDVDEYVDQRSVEYILSGQAPPALLTQNPDESENPFWTDGEDDSDSPEQVEVEDDTGEKHRRFSFEAKGKARAL